MEWNGKTLDELVQLPTHRLLNIFKKVRRRCIGYYNDGTYHGLYEALKIELSKRPHVKRKRDESTERRKKST